MSEKRVSYILPNFFTALNMSCGLFAILNAVNGNIYEACLLVGLGSVFDLFDGRVARWTGTQSEFGEQFDSLSDLVSFGLAPSFIYYFFFLNDGKRVGMIVCLIFVLAGALRLARFNSNIKKVSSEFFQGLPIPSAALAIIGTVLLGLEFDYIKEWKIPLMLYILGYALLMVSNLPFFSFKDSEILVRNRKKVLLLTFALVSVVFIEERIIVCLFLNVYVLLNIIYFLKDRKKFPVDFIEEESVSSSQTP